MSKQLKRFTASVAILSMLTAGAIFAVEEFNADVSAISAVDAEPRWSYMYKVDNGLAINRYEVTVGASTMAYGTNYAYVTAVLQQKQANGSYEDYAEFSDDGESAAAVSQKLTVPYGTYRIVSYHSAGNGTNMEYKTLVGPDKRVPHDTGK